MDLNERVGFFIGVFILVVIFFIIILDKLFVVLNVFNFMIKLLFDMVFSSLMVLVVIIVSRMYYKEMDVKLLRFMKKIL